MGKPRLEIQLTHFPSGHSRRQSRDFLSIELDGQHYMMASLRVNGNQRGQTVWDFISQAVLLSAHSRFSCCVWSPW
jgi:hypothetical protein